MASTSFLDKLKQADDRETRTISVWGMDIHLRSLSALQVMEARDILGAEGDNVSQLKQTAAMLRPSLVDEDGNLVCRTDADMKAVLKNKSAASLGKILREIVDLNGLNEESASGVEVEAGND